MVIYGIFISSNYLQMGKDKIKNKNHAINQTHLQKKNPTYK